MDVRVMLLHLLVKDVVHKLKWLSELEQGCHTLVSLFRYNHLLRSELRDEQRQKMLPAIVKPAATRWGSLVKCFETVAWSEPILYGIVSRRDFLVAKTKKKKKIP